ncbi:MAG TPA: S8 family serine peptidase [Verrucomicrobiota bacterium]|nr:S8 family serine peptidase [Verrucomicrobiota bacterium]
MGLTEEQARYTLTGRVNREVPGRRIPEVVTIEELARGCWENRAVPLPEANTLDNWYYQQRLLGVLDEGTAGQRVFVPQAILLKLRAREILAAIRVPAGREVTAIRILQGQTSVESAGLNSLERRMFSANDPDLGRQWHHQTIGSHAAWDIATGDGSVRLAILDAPFQMNHPDLAANVLPGWDVVGNVPVTNSAGINHSTGTAGVAAAVINNGLGVAGAVNCKLVPISINGTLAEMYLGTLWAASNGVRVVNISWTGAQDATMYYAGRWLKDHARGILAMVGGNSATRINYTNYPTVVAIAGTDPNDLAPFSYGPHIDFAAPGVGLYTTATASDYATQTGTSFATPLFCGVVAALMTINPTLGPDEVIELLKATAADPGTPGWDEHYGWGRVDFAEAARAAAATLRILDAAPTSMGFTVSMTYWPTLSYSLWKTTQLSPPTWQVVSQAILSAGTSESVIRLTDPQPDPHQGFYRVGIQVP